MTRIVVKYVTSGVARGGGTGGMFPPRNRKMYRQNVSVPPPRNREGKGTKGRKEGAKEKEGKI